jgi:TIR domain.
VKRAMSEAKKQYRVYNGGEPYGFISYAHKDAARVLPVIAALSRDRFRLWYDAGIEAGDNWPEVVADHLRRAGTVVFFLSRRFLHSQNCVREVHYAVDRRKPMIAVYLEPLELPSDLAMQFSTATVIQGAEAAPEAIAAEAEGLLGPGFLGDGVTGYETVRIHKPQKNPWRTLSLVFLSLFVLTALLVAGYLGGLLPSLGARTVTVDQAPGAVEAEAVTVTTFQDAFSRDILLRAYQGTSLYLCGNALVSAPAAIRRQGGVWTVAHEPVSPGNPDVLTLVAEKSDLMGLALVDQGIESFEGLTGLQRLVYLDISDNPVRDLSFLAAFPALRTVKLVAVDGADYAVLASLPALEAVYVDEGALSAVLDALSGTDVDVIVKRQGDP